MEGQVAERLARVLAQSPALAHIDLRDNYFRSDGTESLAGVLGHAALSHLNLSKNRIGPDGAESLAGVLGQCWGSAH